MMRVFLLPLVVLIAAPAAAFFANPLTGGTAASKIALDPTFVPPDTTEILEEACKETAQRMKRVLVPVSSQICAEETVGISYVHWPATTRVGAAKLPPVMLLHGFDSSCLEYRRLGSKLAARGMDAYAVDILGWGFTQLEGVTDFSAQAKVEALQSFVTTVVGQDQPFCVAGASLGGATAIELAAAASSTDRNNILNCAGLILIDAQGFVDGVGPMAQLPEFLAKAGVAVLKSEPLRRSANQMSYFDTDKYATQDALNIGRLHCLQQPEWSNAMVNFMKSGGFSPSNKVATIRAPALVVWGRQDTILNGGEFANRFVETLPDARLQWIEDCGHVPHLEQPEKLSQAIQAFVVQTVVASGNSKKGDSKDIFAEIGSFFNAPR